MCVTASSKRHAICRIVIIVYSTVYSAQIKENIKAPRNWSLGGGGGGGGGDAPVTGEFPTQMAGNAKNVFIWWCHHGIIVVRSYNYAHVLRFVVFCRALYNICEYFGNERQCYMSRYERQG